MLLANIVVGFTASWICSIGLLVGSAWSKSLDYFQLIPLILIYPKKGRWPKARLYQNPFLMFIKGMKYARWWPHLMILLMTLLVVGEWALNVCYLI
jgi:hypothetical protein